MKDPREVNGLPPIDSSSYSPCNPLSEDIICSPCRKRPDDGKECLLIKIPKNNPICESCIYIPYGSTLKVYRTQEEIRIYIEKHGIQITEEKGVYERRKNEKEN